MPIRDVDLGIELRVPYVSILDEEGRLDEELDPRIPDDDLRRLYRTMLLARAHDDRRLLLQRQGRIGTFAPVKGQEAAQLGSVYALRETDWMVPAFRETAAGLWRGMSLVADLLYCAGREEGVRIPEESRDLPIAIPVGSQIPHAAGLAWARRLQGTDEVALCYFGDGATSEGDFHEGLNMAAVFDAPAVFLCQNNQYAISVPRSRQTRSRTLAQKAIAYGMPGVQVDGNDILAVYAATRDAVARARRGEGPTLIEAVTYRLGVHTTADDPTKYRSLDEVEEWERKDPLPRFRAYLLEKGVISKDQEAAWLEETREEVAAAVRDFEARPPADPLEMFDHIAAELPPYVRAQRDALAAALERRRAEAEPREERRERVAGPPDPGGTGVPTAERVGREPRRTT